MFTEPIRKLTAIKITEEAEIKFYIHTLISETKSKIYSKPHRYLVAEPEVEIRSNSNVFTLHYTARFIKRLSSPRHR